jgi:hypothetical protein
MPVRFDQATPVPIRSWLEGHTVRTAFQAGLEQALQGRIALGGGTGFSWQLCLGRYPIPRLAPEVRRLTARFARWLWPAHPACSYVLSCLAAHLIKLHRQAGYANQVHPNLNDYRLKAGRIRHD